MLLPGTPPFAFVAILALGVGSSFTLGMALPLVHASDPEEATVWNAFVLAFGYGIGALGPLMVGLLHSSFGGMEPALWMLVGVTLVILVLTPFLGGASRRPIGLDRSRPQDCAFVRTCKSADGSEPKRPA